MTLKQRADEHVVLAIFTQMPMRTARGQNEASDL